MSEISYYKKRLETGYQNLVNADPDDFRTKRFNMEIIMRSCERLCIDLNAFLRDKYVEQYKAEMAMGGNSQDFRCRDCGDTYPTPQARNGHMAHCKQKGGGHE